MLTNRDEPVSFVFELELRALCAVSARFDESGEPVIVSARQLSIESTMHELNERIDDDDRAELRVQIRDAQELRALVLEQISAGRP